MCGCGKPTSIAEKSSRKFGWVAGRPKRFIHGHGRRRYGVENHSWKGGRYIRRGYVMRYAPKHPRADGKGYVPEHQLVMEGLLGRKLRPGEVVHHINGKHDDNRPENLQLMTDREHNSLHATKRHAASPGIPFGHRRH